MLGEILLDLFRRLRQERLSNPSTCTVLNVGGGTKAIPIPAHYDGWRQLLLDVDPKGEPDIVCDARHLTLQAAEQFDAVYCSHNLEHYYAHESLTVLHGFRHVLKERGFVEVRVPDLASVMQHVVAWRLDLEDVLYQSPAGPISVIDVIYGFRREIERSGRDFYAHKTGFSSASLRATLQRAGFSYVFTFPNPPAFELRGLAFKSEPTEAQRRLLRIGESAPGTSG
jgi:SAM-dependent methyltransferase